MIEERTGRRGLLKSAGAAALGATVAGLAKAAPAAAANGGNMVIGTSNTATATTSLTNSGSGDGLEVTTSVADTDAIFGNDTSNSEFGVGVQGSSNGGTGVYGSSSAIGGAAVWGVASSGYGLQGQGGLAPLYLTPAGSAGAPASGDHVLGEVYVDSVGVFYKCVVAGTPGTWVALYSVIPLAAPVRVISTPSGGSNTGGLTGPFNPDGATHTTTVLTGGSTGIPDIAVGVVGNLAISGNGATLNGDGYLTLWPAGTSNPGTSSLNCGGDAFSTANGVTVAFGTGGSAGKLSFSWQGGGSPMPCQVFLDATAFIL